jgi:hypothetical protein
MNLQDFFDSNPFNGAQQSFYSNAAERADAAKGICPEARIVSSQEELAGWFKSVAVAAGVNARSKSSSEPS